ncbi:class II fructose-1,6-bisphosphate aldolase [Paenibacillus hunanensis]|uniref:6-phospho-5-dehydro-2-deoxy-D-gluconate aldolase n=1 Tax=Paenibacillus hunanensis TaxID=539262 RepID=A0ABU1J368_9BACL|nr:class II fructose-1,6-bisphosphate aldolase [Paenibacillus hunanensis]MDR6245953.1 6-phospho-5-dehydro-2-deoxy-D-gluconate aldolase [Paenibacillus hunanensis]GGJ25726.1 6-phospho-5-dehydro-2-deoxy-D-gluconate aldolase [Paenibacillus hunanensis]
MTLVSMKEMLQQAREHQYAVGQFNVNGLSWVHAILDAAQAEQAPVIVAASDRLIDFLGGYRTIATLVRVLVEEKGITVPVALHLDHGKSVDSCLRAIDAGFTSVMFDGSHGPIDQNIKQTRQVVEYAAPHGISVEAEVGTVGGIEDGLIGGIQYADLHECVRIVEETGIDALAAALGSVHGKYIGEPKLGFTEMEAISQAIGIPLVLHGASGIPLHQLTRAIELGHAKVNINTESVTAWSLQLRQTLADHPDTTEPRTILTPARQAIEDSVRAKIREFRSSGKAAISTQLVE